MWHTGDSITIYVTFGGTRIDRVSCPQKCFVTIDDIS